MTIHEASQRMAAKTLSSVELTKDFLKRIAAVNAKLNAYHTVTADLALEQARRADEERSRGRVRGPLHGIPVAVKDVFCTKGIVTADGSRLFADHVPSHDAAVVERLASAGAVLLGKTEMHELAYGVTSNNPHFGPVRNPWNTNHVPGGSSGGSGSAVGAGIAMMAMGSDTGGSIRIPAAFCGTTGIKPTAGRVSRYGVMPLDFTLDHMGPLAMTVRDTAVCLEAIAGYDPRDDSSSKAPVGAMVPAASVSLKGLRIGLPENFFYDRLNASVEKAVRALVPVAERLGAAIVAVRVPDMQAINATARVILLSEASAALGAYLHRRDEFGADTLALFDQGRLIAATDYVNAQRLRCVFQREFARVWKHADCLLTPTTPNLAPRIGDSEIDVGGGVMEDVRLASTRLVRAINLLSLPALSIPCGIAQGLPIGAQIIGPPFEEALLFRVGAALEDAIGAPKLAPV